MAGLILDGELPQECYVTRKVLHYGCATAGWICNRWHLSNLTHLPPAVAQAK